MLHTLALHPLSRFEFLDREHYWYGNTANHPYLPSTFVRPLAFPNSRSLIESCTKRLDQVRRMGFPDDQLYPDAFSVYLADNNQRTHCKLSDGYDLDRIMEAISNHVHDRGCASIHCKVGHPHTRQNRILMRLLRRPDTSLWVYDAIVPSKHHTLVGVEPKNVAYRALLDPCYVSDRSYSALYANRCVHRWVNPDRC